MTGNRCILLSAEDKVDEAALSLLLRLVNSLPLVPRVELRP
jgi:hypothetical protein